MNTKVGVETPHTGMSRDALSCLGHSCPGHVGTCRRERLEMDLSAVTLYSLLLIMSGEHLVIIICIPEVINDG